VQCGVSSWILPNTLLPASGPAEHPAIALCVSPMVVVAPQVAQFKATVLLLPNGSDRVTSAPVQPWESEKKVEDEEVLKLLATSLKKSKSSKKTAKKKARTPARGQFHCCGILSSVSTGIRSCLQTNACPEPDPIAWSP